MTYKDEILAPFVNQEEPETPKEPEAPKEGGEEEGEKEEGEKTE